MLENLNQFRLRLLILFYLIVSAGWCVSLFVGCRSKTEKTETDSPVAVIAGGSMAPTLVGKHYQLICPDCDFPFPVDALDKPESGDAVCPNCGFSKVPYEESARNAPEEVRIKLGNDNIKRWDIIAFQFEESEKKGVKRVVGLPGETIQIKDGDIWVDGKIAERSQAQKTSMMIPQFASRYSPKTIDTGSRWNLQDNPNWTIENGRFVCRAVNRDSGETEAELANGKWETADLVYQPTYCFASSNNRKPLDTIVDSYGYNQNHSRQKLNPIDQIRVEFPLKLKTDCRLTFSTFCDGKNVVFEIAPKQSRAIIRADNQSVKGELPKIEKWDNVHVAFCTMDSQPTLIINDQTVCELTLPPRKLAQRELQDNQPEFAFAIRISQSKTDSPLPMKADSIAVASLGPIEIFRDLYYFSDYTKEFTLGDEQFMVLGDNVPISIDSRTWSEPSIKRRQIIGTLLAD